MRAECLYIRGEKEMFILARTTPTIIAIDHMKTCQLRVTESPTNKNRNVLRADNLQ